MFSGILQGTSAVGCLGFVFVFVFLLIARMVMIPKYQFTVTLLVTYFSPVHGKINSKAVHFLKVDLFNHKLSFILSLYPS